MKKRQVKDMAASVHQRLLNKSRQTGHPFNELLQYYAMERFLYRLSKSGYGNRFILKGALMLTVWKGPMSRPTRDMDFLGKIGNDIGGIAEAVRDVCSTEVEPDGIEFNPDTIEAERVTEDADYEGVRVRFQGHLGSARTSMQLDVAFGDVVVPGTKIIEYPTIIEMPPPVLTGYSMESTIAEKFEAMVKLGIINSRMKDFFDIWLLSQLFEFSGETLASAMATTFEIRNTDISNYSSVFSADFMADQSNATQWQAFLRRTAIELAPSQFSTVVEQISVFLSPPAEAVARGTTFRKSWKARGPWQ
ncbi:MAG: nucleotidyl transferase AbiEii/AbiGii toxin family protein [Candidatus Eisenbacteria bacterium]